MSCTLRILPFPALISLLVLSLSLSLFHTQYLSLSACLSLVNISFCPFLVHSPHGEFSVRLEMDVQSVKTLSVFAQINRTDESWNSPLLFWNKTKFEIRKNKNQFKRVGGVKPQAGVRVELPLIFPGISLNLALQSVNFQMHLKGRCKKDLCLI